MNGTVIHIGYHKSASTLLQKEVFPRLAVPYVFLADSQRMMLETESTEAFDPAAFQKAMHEAAASDGSDGLLISHEALTGHPHGRHKSEPEVVAQNLKAAFPEARILVVVRNPMEYLTSIYTYRVAIKGVEYRSFDRFLDEDGARGLFEHLEYHKLVSRYMELFGRDRVLVVPMEYLHGSRGECLREMFEFMGVDDPGELPVFPHVNQSTKVRGVIAFWRPVNFFVLKVVFALFRIGGRKSRFEPTVRYGYFGFKQRMTGLMNRLFAGARRISIHDYSRHGELRAQYAASIAQLGDMTGRDFQRFGYPAAVRVPESTAQTLKEEQQA